MVFTVDYIREMTPSRCLVVEGYMELRQELTLRLHLHEEQEAAAKMLRAEIDELDRKLSLLTGVDLCRRRAFVDTKDN